MSEEKNIPYAAFGERLTALRKQNKMSRQQLGDLCGVAPSTIVNYERVSDEWKLIRASFPECTRSYRNRHRIF
ncbi:MAG: helix-turn-helix transcriptional regulator [Clostridia bacterium]|nr:helix-turn-helix transcriptional regulator [Clostridia bacterium]